MSGIPSSSIARKIIMALSGLFLVVFLGQHFVINITSVIAPDTFNTWSHFMGYNPLVQYALQPVLIGGVIVHFVMGFVLEIQNRKARGVRYFKYNGGANTSWISRNMIISGATVLAFFFVLLALHLLHGFASSFQTMGVNNKYSAAIKTFTKVYAIVIPLGFAFIAIYHHLNPITH